MVRRVVQIIGTIVLLGYPFAVYVGLTRFEVRTAALVLLALIAPAAIWRITKSRERGAQLKSLAIVPLVTVVLLAGSATLKSSDLILAVPVFINLVLLGTFASTLIAGRPMIERFARLQEPDLSSDKVSWCRMWTWLWCAFFLVNGSCAAWLALFSPLEWWALYNGFVAYMLIGLMFAAEYGLRRLKFGPTPTGSYP